MGLSNARTQGGEGLRAPMPNRFGGAERQGGGSWPEGREAARPVGAGAARRRGRRRQPGRESRAGKAGQSRSLRLLDDAHLDRVADAVTDSVRPRGGNASERPPGAARSPMRVLAKAARAKPDNPDRTAKATAGQERLILAAFDAALRPEAIAKGFRVSWSAVEHVINDRQRDRRRTERWMVEGHRRTDMPWRLNAGDFATMTGAAALSFERTGKSRPALGLRQSTGALPAQSSETSK